MPMMPLLISLAIATISSAYILQDHQQEVSKVTREGSLESLKRSVKALSPQSNNAVCEPLNDRFANYLLPTGTIWTVTVHQPQCDWAELQLVLADGINPRTMFPTVRNDHISGQTITLPLNLVDPLSPYIPYQQKLLGAQRNATRTCSSYNCIGDNAGLIYLVHGKSAAKCINADGSLHRLDGGSYICRFAGSSCPSGWAQYKNYSTTVNVYGGVGGVCGTNYYRDCNTGSHSFSNTTRESCRWKNEWRRPVGSCKGVWNTTWARLTEMGCY